MKKFASLILSAVVLATLTASPSYGQSAQDVLNKMIDAMGGRKALQAVKDTTIVGAVEIVQAGMTASITIYQKEPNKLRADIEISDVGMTITQTYDGQKAWWTNPQTGQNEELTGPQAQEIMHQAIGNASLLDPQKLGITYALKPKAPLDGKDYIVLEQTLSDGHKITIYIDPATYLPYMARALSLDAMTGAEADTETYLSDYRKVGGLMVAHSNVSKQNGVEAQKLNISSVTFNTDLADSLFILK
jgi:outer membrane lipoprotein-sorting protein